ncbi:glycosyltransferase family 4 protein [Mycolicibacterium komossense]|uniref:Glycosyltransferase family 4 protein n=1 Tax=Mycolicibacterium komossense TaxID=1779 RepID=A0ABT3CJL7_9MYCO|nr:glycosyltransferase family 4 protein [Mycolicibacterium komossense]MCV7229639.1 glycosyltransferase family 4 protein [Mycolicibacterium komossense]
MKVLLLAQFLPPIIGGVERHVWTLAKALAARSHEVTLLGLCTGDEQPGESHSDGVRIVRVRTAASHLPFLYSDPRRPHSLPVPDPLVSRAIRHELSATRFDVIHAHNWIVNSALGPARRAGVPVVVTLHDYSHFCATARLMEKGEQRCHGPSAARCLACAASHFDPIKGPIVVAANTWSARQRRRRVARVVAVSAAVASAVDGHDKPVWLRGAGLDAEVIPNFIPDEIVVDDIVPARPDAPLLFAGDLTPDKGVPILLEAYRLLDNPPPLLLAGRPTPEVARMVPDGVQLLGTVPHHQALELFRSARAVIVPSVWSDPCPTVVLEAMAAGRPVVAAASGGIRDMVVDGVTGLLVPPGDIPALAHAINAILSNSQTAKAFGVAGRNRVREFTVSAVVDRIERMYAGAIAEVSPEVAARAG